MAVASIRSEFLPLEQNLLDAGLIRIDVDAAGRKLITPTERAQSRPFFVLKQGDR